MADFQSGTVGVKTLPRCLALFGIYWVCVTLVNWQTLSSLWQYSRENPSASHLVLIPFVTAALIYQNRKSIFSSTQYAIGPGVGVITAGLALFVASRLPFLSQSADARSWMVGAMVVLWIGGFLLFYGPKAARAALFPLLFLAFTVPIPSILLDGATFCLKVGSTEAVNQLFALTQTTYFREGFVFALPAVTIEIADECSGIRSSIALVLTSLLAGEAFLLTTWTRVLLVMAVLPVAVLKNAVRIVGLTLLAQHVDPGYLTGQLHHEGGIVFFVLSLAVLAPVLAILRKFETAPAKPT